MAKEKKQIPKSTKKDFFYELSGTLTILLCLVLLSELGTVGIFLKTTFKIIFGDFYFVVVLYLIGQGIYALVKEKWFDFKSIRFNGFLLFLFSLFLIVHISFLDLYQISNQTILSSSLETYKSSIIDDKLISSYGGGVVGAIFAQIFVVLFSKVGAIIFSLIFMIIALSFITNISFKSVMHSLRYSYDKGKKLGLFFYRYFKNINYPSKKDKTIKRGVIVNLNLLTDIPLTNNKVLQQKIASDEFDAITRYIYSLNGYITDKKMIVGFSSSRYYFCGNFNGVNDKEITNILKRNCLFYKEERRIIVECSNKLKDLLTLKTLLLMSQTKEVPIGLELTNVVLNFNPITHQNILISGDGGSGIKTFVKAFVVSLLFKFKEDFNLILCDYLDEFNDLKYLPNLYYPVNKKINDLDDILDYLTVELERRLNILNENAAENYLSLNMLLTSKKIEEIKPIYLIINNLDALRNKNYNLNNKILYFLKFGYKCGIHLILINRTKGIDETILSNTKTKILLKTSSIEQSYEIVGNKNGCFLNGNGDGLMVFDAKIYHLQLPYISDSDYHKIIGKFILN